MEATSKSPCASSLFFTKDLLSAPSSFFRSRYHLMMAQNHFCTFYKANLLLSLLLHLSQVPLFANEILKRANIEMEKRSHRLPHWIEELPDSIPLWMKISASIYRGSPQQVTCAMVKMAKALEDMRAARARNCDSYFRCRGSLLAAKCGIYATSFARYIR